MKRFLLRALAVVGALSIVSCIAGSVFLISLFQNEAELPSTIVLDLDLDRKLPESGANNGGPTASLMKEAAGLREIVQALDRAREDPRVRGVVARLNGDVLGFAQTQELRAAVARFRASGRFAYAYSDSFGEFAPGNKSYYLASAFDEVWMQPQGVLGLTGLSAEVPFARPALDKLQVIPDIDHREEYKSAMETLTEGGFSKPHREMMESLLSDLTQQMVEGIAADRKQEPTAIQAALDRGPLLDQETVTAKLVDRLDYYDVLMETAEKRAGEDAEMVDVGAYLDDLGPLSEQGGPTIAVIYGLGVIQRGENNGDSGVGEMIMGADAIASAFEDAVNDEDVRAIVFRIDSGGGSVVASETIRRAVVRAREAGKPVIASMGDAAASGGYWIALAADRIIAQPGTLTGSIGVFAGKIVLGEFWRSLGVHWESIEKGRNAEIWSDIRPYSETGRARLKAMLDSVYSTFVAKVAEARHISVEEVRKIAKGRVWTGRQAVKIGLVDELGDFNLALVRAREAIGLAPDDEIVLEVFPPSRTLLEQALDLVFGRNQTNSGVLLSLQPILARLRPLLAIGAADHAVQMPPTGLLP
ncbi:Protease 4 [Azospirillaceae bacterium]